MKNFKYIYIGVLSTLLSGTFVSCENYLDINENPNYPGESQVAVSALLPSAFTGSAGVMGYLYQLYGSMWSQHYTQNPSSSQYITLVNYAMTSSSDLRLWRIPYADVLPDLDLVIQKSEAEGAWNYWVVGKVMTAFTYHVLTDAYGDIPFTEALKGKNCKYDDSKTVVYPGIIQMLNDAIGKADDASVKGLLSMSVEDYVYDGDMTKWIRFAKTLKLKLLMRDFEANKTEIQTMLTAGDFLKDDATIHCFEDVVNKSNPFYENDRRQLNTTNNVRACTTLYQYLDENGDPRIEDFYETTAGSDYTAYKAIPYGSRDSKLYSIRATSRAVIGALDPVYYMSAAETEYLLSECYARLGDKGNAKTHYENAVKLSFERWNHDATDFIIDGGKYAFDETSEDAMLKCILTQKWVASTRCQAWDTWFDINRTRIPALGNVETTNDNYVTGELAYNPNSSLAKGAFPSRFIYSKESLDYNTSAPTIIPGITESLWWHKK